MHQLILEIWFPEGTRLTKPSQKYGNCNQCKMKKMKMMRIWRYKKTVQKLRSCYSSCLVRASETPHITAFHDLRKIANFTSQSFDWESWAGFLLGRSCYSFADGSFNASTVLNTGRGWVHFGTILQCTWNCIYPVSLRKNCAALPRGIHSNFSVWCLAGLSIIYSFAWCYFCIVNISLSLS